MQGQQIGLFPGVGETVITAIVTVADTFPTTGTTATGKANGVYDVRRHAKVRPNRLMQIVGHVEVSRCCFRRVAV